MSSARLLGVIDFGTVALRFDLYQVSSAYEFHLVNTYRALPRLGEVLSEREEFRARVLCEFERVAELSQQHNVREFLAVGTSAFRDVPEGNLLLEEIAARFGIRLEVLSGEEEAALTARGILSHERNLPLAVLLVDIGGGSTEVSFCSEGKPALSMSMDVGCVTVKRGGTSENIRGELRKMFSGLTVQAKKFAPEIAIGSSGTIRAIEKILAAKRKSDAQSSQSEPIATHEVRTLSELLNRLSSLDMQALLAVPGVEHSRADILIPGMIVFEELLSAVGVTKFRVTHFSLRHGVLDRWKSLQTSKP